MSLLIATLFNTFTKVQSWKDEFTNNSQSHNEIWPKKDVRLTKPSVHQALLKAKSHAKKGDIDEAQKLYQAVLQAFPKNKRAQQGLAALNKPQPSTSTQIPPQDTINQLINLYNQGQLAAVVDQAQALTKQYPEVFAIWNIGYNGSDSVFTILTIK